MFLIYFQRESYSLSELQKVPPPQGVDPAKLEAYLSDSSFQVRRKQEASIKKLSYLVGKEAELESEPSTFRLLIRKVFVFATRDSW